VKDFLARFRDPEIARALVSEVRRLAAGVADRLGRRAVLMEVCGTHTVAISRAGLRGLLKDLLDLRSGPGCPVCVTDYVDIDRMVALARLPGVTVGTFGDMLRVPGSYSSLERERAAGADVRIFYSPADAVAWAAAHPEREVVFLGVGFETTAPAVAASIKEAKARGIENFSVYTNHKLVPPALGALLDDQEIMIDGFILPGHVSAIIGRRAYSFLEEFRLPAVITGFEINDILESMRQILKMLWKGEPRVQNGYTRVVREEGNGVAKRLMAEVFQVTDASWRGFGVIPASGLELTPSFKAFEAAARFSLPVVASRAPAGCACGEILKGKLSPKECRLFGVACTPSSPVGPCMVSSEGACGAYYQFERVEGENMNYA